MWSVNSEDMTAGGDLTPAGGVGVRGDFQGDSQRDFKGDFQGDFLGYVDDQGTYEQVLFINGRPQYQDDLG